MDRQVKKYRLQYTASGGLAYLISCNPKFDNFAYL